MGFNYWLEAWLETFLNPEVIILISFFASIFVAVLFYFWWVENREKEKERKAKQRELEERIRKLEEEKKERD